MTPPEPKLWSTAPSSARAAGASASAAASPRVRMWSPGMARESRDAVACYTAPTPCNEGGVKRTQAATPIPEGRPMAVHAVPDALTEAIAGVVLRPGDADYDDARSVWNAVIDRRPAAIVRCAGTADVIAAVTFARDQQLPLSVKAGGHNVAGTAVNDGGIVIDLSELRGVHVDHATGVVRVAGGATWADVDRETQLHGLAVPGGVVSTTGVAGLTLHGGIGHLRRKHGLSIDNLLSVDVVTADGQLRTAGADEHEDLFWAIRGAGSNFGVVTSFEFQAHPVGPEVAVAAVFYPHEHARAVLSGWRDAMAAAPDEVSSLAVCWSVPAQAPFLAELHGAPGVLVAGVYAGPVPDGEPVVAPLRELAE